MQSVPPGSRRWPFRLVHALIAAATLAVTGCATEADLRSVTYQYTDRTRLGAEQRAHQEIWDDCYFAGAQYPWLVGKPQVTSEDGATGRYFQVTQTFYCVGDRGEA